MCAGPLDSDEAGPQPVTRTHAKYKMQMVTECNVINIYMPDFHETLSEMLIQIPREYMDQPLLNRVATPTVKRLQLLEVSF